MIGFTKQLRAGVALGTLLCCALVAGAAQADTQSCREWRAEHLEYKTQALGRFLGGASQASIDEAVFEMLQREAWLTSCDVSVRVGRDELVGWRLGDRAPDEYGNAVVESVLERAGFDVGLAGLFVQTAPPVANVSNSRSSRRVRAR